MKELGVKNLHVVDRQRKAGGTINTLRLDHGCLTLLSWRLLHLGREWKNDD